MLTQVWCVAPNDHFVMHAWGHELGAHGKVRRTIAYSFAVLFRTDTNLILTARCA